jgi:multisubunit Na+/H+ antiporter MnhB subunit
VPDPRQVQRTSTYVLSAAMVVIGIAMIVVTLTRGGGALAGGLVLGILFCAAGAGRLFIERRRS